MLSLNLPSLADISPRALETEANRRAALGRLRQYFQPANVPRAFGMAPLPILDFHMGQQVGRVVVGANKSAKTIGGAVETVCWLQGEHPFRATPRPPVYGRVVTPALPGGHDDQHVQRDTIKAWCPEAWLRGGSWLRAYSIVGHTLHLANGSVLEFLSSEQAADVHAGENRHFVWIDEEAPRLIYTENMARLAREGVLGCWWWTYAPILGLIWMEEEIYGPGLTKGFLWEVDIEDNRHNLPEGFIEAFEAGLREDEKAGRLRGKYGRREGLVYDIVGAKHFADFEVVAG